MNAGIGQPVRRREDFRFITGSGQYTDDINRPGQSYAVFVRSPHAHATIRKIDVAAAKNAPGVVAIFTSKELAADKIGTLACGWMVLSKDGSPMRAGVHPVLAVEKVRYVGDHVAVVIAETMNQARDAAELVSVDYDVHAAVVDLSSAQQASEPQIHAEAPNNTVFQWHLGDKAAVDAAFGKAKHVTRIDLANNRLIPNEEQAVGGLYTVRGYPESITAGDNAVIASLEYRFHLPRTFRVSEPGHIGERPIGWMGRDFRWAPQQSFGRADWDLIFKAFIDAHSLLMKQARTEKDAYYPFKVARSYHDFVLQNGPRFVPEQLGAISGAVQQMIKQVDRSSKHVLRYRLVQEARADLLRTSELLKSFG